MATTTGQNLTQNLMEENVLKIFFSGTTEPFKRKFQQNMILYKIEMFSAAWKSNKAVTTGLSLSIFSNSKFLLNPICTYIFFCGSGFKDGYHCRTKLKNRNPLRKIFSKCIQLDPLNHIKKETWLSLTFAKCLFIVPRENSRRPPPRLDLIQDLMGKEWKPFLRNYTLH